VVITARLEESSVRELLDQLLPARVLLDEERQRWIDIEKARTVDFVAGEGLRVETAGQLQWPTAGLSLGVTFTSAQLLLRPEVIEDPHGGRLVFRPSLQALDLKNVPAFFDARVLARVNTRLAAQGDELGWTFGKTLAIDLALPPTLVPLDKFGLAARTGVVSVEGDAIVFSVEMTLSFSRRPEE
jgi:hypothetical protein